MKLVHWALMGGLLHLVQQGGDWAGLQPAQAPPCCTKCNSPPINGQCTNHRIDVPIIVMTRCSALLMWPYSIKGQGTTTHHYYITLFCFAVYQLH